MMNLQFWQMLMFCLVSDIMFSILLEVLMGECGSQFMLCLLLWKIYGVNCLVWGIIKGRYRCCCRLFSVCGVSWCCRQFGVVISSSGVFFSFCFISLLFGSWFRWMVRLKFLVIRFMLWLVMFSFICICGYCCVKCVSMGGSWQWLQVVGMFRCMWLVSVLFWVSMLCLVLFSRLKVVCICFRQSCLVLVSFMWWVVCCSSCWFSCVFRWVIVWFSIEGVVDSVIVLVVNELCLIIVRNIFILFRQLNLWFIWFFGE